MSKSACWTVGIGGIIPDWMVVIGWHVRKYAVGYGESVRGIIAKMLYTTVMAVVADRVNIPDRIIEIKIILQLLLSHP